MFDSLEVLFTPAELVALSDRDLSQTTCVVFDILRATSTIVTALANGADSVIPVAEIPEALEIRRQRHDVLLAGERDGWRIHAGLAGGVEFDLGNSPREFTADKINGRTIVLSTTNGSRALRACAHANAVLAASFLNLRATSDFLRRHSPARLLLICAGTRDQAAYEDVYGAGALIENFCGGAPKPGSADSAWMAWEAFDKHPNDPLTTLSHSRNGCRLQSMPELRDDIAFCAQLDIFPLVAKSTGGIITKAPA